MIFFIFTKWVYIFCVVIKNKQAVIKKSPRVLAARTKVLPMPSSCQRFYEHIAVAHEHSFDRVVKRMLAVYANKTTRLLNNNEYRYLFSAGESFSRYPIYHTLLCDP